MAWCPRVGALAMSPMVFGVSLPTSSRLKNGQQLFLEILCVYWIREARGLRAVIIAVTVCSHCARHPALTSIRCLGSFLVYHLRYFVSRKVRTYPSTYSCFLNAFLSM
ncbi:hypothetical protein F5Y15DRAFT_312365 [Xylariaceae sp. FL0016]|nr:hypothetical protein F5Y15DRAFT_312365 [Xylariaceae sp. FL0016]